MKLREALAASNCGKVMDNCDYIYEGSTINSLRFDYAERDYWEPVIEKKTKQYAQAVFQDKSNLESIFLCEKLFLSLEDVKTHCELYDYNLIKFPAGEIIEVKE